MTVLFTSFNLGYFQYVGNLLNLYYHKNIEKAQEVFSSGLKFSGFILLLVFVVGLVLSVPRISSYVLSVDLDVVIMDRLNIALLFSLVAHVIFQIVMRLGVKLFEPIGQIYLIPKIEVFFEVIEISLLVSYLLYDGNVLGLIVVYVSWKVFFCLGLLLFLSKKFPHFFMLKKRGSLKEGFFLFRRSFSFLVSNVSDKLSIDGLPLLISHIFGAALVPVYVTIRTIGNVITSSTNFIVNSSLPEFQRFYVKGEFKKIELLSQTLWFFLTLPVNIGIILILPFLNKLYVIWTQGKLSFDLNLMILILCSTIIINFSSIVVAFLKAINQTDFLLKLTVGRILILFVATIGFINIGLPSVGLALFMSELVMSFFYANHHLRKVFGGASIVRIVDVLPTVMTILFLLSKLFWDYTFLFDIALVIFLIMAYAIRWGQLDSEVKTRILSLFIRK